LKRFYEANDQREKDPSEADATISTARTTEKATHVSSPITVWAQFDWKPNIIVPIASPPSRIRPKSPCAHLSLTQAEVPPTRNNSRGRKYNIEPTIVTVRLDKKVIRPKVPCQEVKCSLPREYLL